MGGMDVASGRVLEVMIGAVCSVDETAALEIADVASEPGALESAEMASKVEEATDVASEAISDVMLGAAENADDTSATVEDTAEEAGTSPSNSVSMYSSSLLPAP